MGFYAQVIAPLLCDFGLDRPFVARYRRELLAHAGGNILEIGFGTGLNLPCYPPQVRKVTTVDPNVGMYRRARRRIKQAGIEIDRRLLGGERLPFEDGSFDCVVSTFTLCSIEEVAQAGGAVLEIGFGTGLNLPCYPRQVGKVTAVDPSAGMYRRARRRIRQARIEVDRRVLGGERLPFDDATFDCVVSTFTLCSIEQVDQAVREVYRVLIPGGKFLLLEHGFSPEPKVQKWQRRLNWLQMRLAGGCHLDRDMRALVTAQPFASVQMDEFYIEKTPKTHGYMYRAVATK